MKTEAQVVLMAKVNIDVLPNVINNKVVGIGIRIRPYGKQAARDVMILGYGATFDLALEDCYAKAYAKRWESLSWSARPWETEQQDASGDPFSGPEDSRQTNHAPF